MNPPGSHAWSSETPTFSTLTWLVCTTLLISIATLLVWRFSPFHVKLVIERIPEPVKAAVEQQTTKSKDESALVPDKREPRPFKFRNRLWHEPPELDYTAYEFYDEVQKEFKNDGGRELEWRTRWLDLKIENNLVRDYRAWTVSQARRTRPSEKENGVYRALLGELNNERQDVMFEWHEISSKDKKDHNELWEYVERIKREKREAAGSVKTLG